MLDEHALNSVNRYYLDKVMNLAEERDIKTTEDIFDARGMKLVAKGTTVSRKLQERLMVRQLSKPFEASITVDGGVDMDAIIEEAQRIADTVEPVKVLLNMGQGGASPLKILSDIRFGSAMGTMLTVIQGGGQHALQHAVLVTLISISLAKKCGMSGNDQISVALAGLLHDIGELYIDPEYLHSSRRLHPHEWRHVVVHPRIGQKLIEGLESYPPMVARAVFEHHERLDGGGYPRGVSGGATSLAGQVVSAAEMISGVFLSKDQPLKRAELALKIIPGEHPHELVSAVAAATQKARMEKEEDAASVPSGEEADSVLDLYHRIGSAMENAQALLDSGMLRSVKAQQLLKQIMQRGQVIARAFSSTGLDACLRHAPDMFASHRLDILFEAAVVVREIEWRMRGIARDLALHSTALEPHESDALQPLVVLFDAQGEH